MSDLDDARTRYRFALAPEDYERLPFYSALLALMHDDDVSLELLASVRREQRLPMLILASLHLVALRGHPTLGPIYENARHGRLEDVEVAARAVLEVLRASPELVANELWRSTQTNEPGRSAVLQAVIADLTTTEAAINVIEVGTSAGINLWFDQFPVRAHDDQNPLTLVCDDRSTVRRNAPFDVRRRVGVDLNPLDLDDLDDRLWLKACIWPEEQRRHQRFDAVVATHSSWPATTKLKGSALARLGDAFSLVDGDVLTVVYNTWVAFYFSPEERRAYFEELTRRCEGSRVAWISVESTLVAWPNVEVDVRAHHKGASQIVVTRPASTPALWGWCHAHGRWLETVNDPPT